jgi:methylamine--corrinoid protein Co-methyltransferase
MRTNWLVEITKRAQSGPFMKENDYDLMLTRRIKDLVKQYGVKYDANNLVPADDDMADRVFQAGLQLFCEVGVYCQTTERIIKFSRQEVLDILAMVPSQVTLGTGNHASPRRGRPHSPDRAFRPDRHPGQ